MQQVMAALQSAATIVAASGILNWADGDVASKTFTVSITNDTAIESDETINLALSNPTNGAVIGSLSTAILTILDNDGPPILRFENSSYSISEGGGQPPSGFFALEAQQERYRLTMLRATAQPHQAATIHQQAGRLTGEMGTLQQRHLIFLLLMIVL